MRVVDQVSLKTFLKKELAALSDADPDILSDYVLALLKHDRADLEDFVASQLSDFLHDHSKEFVQRLVKHIKSLERPEPSNFRNDSRDDHRRHDGRREQRRSRSPRKGSDRFTTRSDEASKRRLKRHGGAKSENRLVCDRIPVEQCTEEQLMNYFSRFGKVGNVLVDRIDCRAIIEFELNDDAQRAFDCPDAIFGNRFVRLYFDREPVQEPSKPKSLPLVTTYTAPNYQPPQRPVAKSATLMQQEKVKQKARLLDLSKQKQELLTACLEQQKLLLSKLEGTEGPGLDESAKQELMDSLRLLDEKIRSISIERPGSPDQSSLPIQEQPKKSLNLSRKLDLRPTSIIIRPVPEKLLDNNVEAAKILFATFGVVQNVHFEADHLVVAFNIRVDAEKVQLFGHFMHNLGLQITSKSKSRSRISFMV